MDLLINSIKIASIVAAGVFGMMGLLTKYKDGDQITRWGRIALGGIILSAVLSLAVQLLQTAKETRKQQAEAIRAATEAQKAEQAAKATSEHLSEILKTAQKTSDRQSENLDQAQLITEKMDTSLKAQDKVLSGNKQILGGIVEGAQRDTKNTIGVLRTIWDESNRIEANQVTVEITYTFTREVVKPPPLLLDKGESLSLAVAASDSRIRNNAPLNRWSSAFLLEKPELVLRAREQKISRKEHRTIDDVGYQQTSYFSAFDGDIKSFSDMSRWNGAFIETVLNAQDPSLFNSVWKSVDWKPDHKGDVEDLRRTYDVPADVEEDDYYIAPMPVHARMVIYVRERPIATSEGYLVAVREHDEDVKGLIVAKFKVAKIAEQYISTVSTDSLN